MVQCLIFDVPVVGTLYVHNCAHEIKICAPDWMKNSAFFVEHQGKVVNMSANHKNSLRGVKILSVSTSCDVFPGKLLISNCMISGTIWCK